jgi:hypothetical protein
MSEPLQEIVDALGAHAATPRGQLGDQIVEACEICGWRAWSYTAYCMDSIEVGGAFLRERVADHAREKHG